ncbi:hypothetical protein [Verrucomicrobium sp. BvORR106]|uniref:hypothetical protein n=1 Tax=Verrucomicrobium sp. BvORR106 TaxID=1403819 RepID=UPI00224101F7|nr:hypothetical protein [Verrucomicrobium sp. BvORR106]
MTSPLYDTEDESDKDHPVTKWLTTLNPILKEECQLTLASSLEDEALRPSSVQISAVFGQVSLWSLSTPLVKVSDVLTFLARPFRILVENRRNDRAFLLSFAKPWMREKIVNFESQGWLIFDHCGGLGEMLNSLRDMRERAIEQLRTYVVFDHDGLRRARPSQSSTLVSEACQPHILFHRLERRMIENYMPRELLGIWANKEKKAELVAAFLSLNEEQRHFYNFKGGLHSDARRTDDPEANTFSGLDSTRTNQLRNGFGRGIVDLFRQESYWDETWFADEDCASEISSMMNILTSML